MTPNLHRSNHEAMTTTFEIVVADHPANYARQAARAAFDEIDRLEQCLSRFIESSDISRINLLAAEEPVRVSLDTFECLQLAARISAETHGAFDVTRVRGGMDKVEFDKAQITIALKDAEISLDLGGIGKGFALDKAAEIMNEWSVETALIRAGDSSVLALGVPPDDDGWRVNVGSGAEGDAGREEIMLSDRAVRGSGTSVRGQHIIAPRTGRPAEGPIRTWASCPSATVSDALSTAFMVMSSEEVERLCVEHPDTWAVLLTEDDRGIRRLERFGNR